MRTGFTTFALLAFAPVTAAVAQKKTTQNGWVGISVIQKGHGNATSTSMDYPVVASVEPGSPAQAAGLVAGDTIIAYNSFEANTDPGSVKRFLKPGTELVLRIRRNGVRNLRLTVARSKLQARNSSSIAVSTEESTALPLVTPTGSGPVSFAVSVAPGREAPLAGAYFAQLNAGLARALSVSGKGVLVVDAAPGSPAARTGLQAGDVILRADSIAVVSPLEIATAMRLAAGRRIKLQLSRDGKPETVTVSW